MQANIESLEEVRIVSVARGSWRWQNAYRVVRYHARQTRDGRWIWYSAERLTGKRSLPQLKRLGWTSTPHGSLHNKPVIVPEYRDDATTIKPTEIDDSEAFSIGL